MATGIEGSHPSPSFVLREVLDVNLRSIYAADSEGANTIHTIHVRWGNFTLGDNRLMLNLQRQLEMKGLTYKPWGTHLTVVYFPHTCGASHRRLLKRHIADILGDREYGCNFVAWGDHSVHVVGELYSAIRCAVGSVPSYIEIIPCEELHVELIPRCGPYQRHMPLDFISQFEDNSDQDSTEIASYIRSRVLEHMELACTNPRIEGGITNLMAYIERRAREIQTIT